MLGGEEVHCNREEWGMLPRVMRRRPPIAVAVACALCFTGSARGDLGGEPSACHALVNARIVAAPGATPFDGTIVIRDGRIESVGKSAQVPSDAIVHDLTGRFVFPGLVEAYLRLPESEDDAPDSVKSASRHENKRIRAEVRAADLLPIPKETLDEMRAAGFAVVQAAPASGILRGTSAVLSLGDALSETAPAGPVLNPDFAQVMAFEHSSWGDDSYPNSLMGAIALIRQTLIDAPWQRDAEKAWTRDPANASRPTRNLALEALLPVTDRTMPVAIECESVAMIERALRIAREFKVRPILVSGGSDEWRRIDWVARELPRAGASLIVAVNFPKPPNVDDPEDRVSIELADLLEWERAPGNLAALEKAKIPFAVTTQGLEKRTLVLDRLREATEHGLSRTAALASITTVPAKLLGIDSRAGTIAAGKDAHLVVATRDLLERGAEIEAVWVDGVRFGEYPKRARESDVAGKWDLEVGAGSRARTVRVEFERSKESFNGKVIARQGETLATDSTSVNARKFRDLALAHGTISFAMNDAAWDGPDAKMRLTKDGKILRGETDVGGDTLPVIGRKAPTEPVSLLPLLSLNAPTWPPVASKEDAPSAVLVKGATVWTCGEKGRLEDTDILVRDGVIAQVGRNLKAPKGALVVEAEGRHVTPGLIDCHSHSDIAGGVNEGTNSCTAEVRIADVVDPDAPAMMRELAGGLTVSNLLHGSANAIGGQNAVIKLRWGATADELIFKEAPQGIKFALGENVKQSNWGEKYVSRYPQTRMGVEQFIRERFLAARAARDEAQAWRGGKRGAPPHRDLQLEAIQEILDGKRLVHCHSYRADEILMLIRLADEQKFRVGTFQHVLEGYKCADEIAAHGAGASAFSDWWSYKYEVVDAIPYAGEIMWKRGVVTSFNSDSYDLARRLNLEAAKAVKYGGVPEEEALKFVTLNPAKQLGIDRYVGSLEPKKHADFVLWSGHPLSDGSICLETWIDGVRRFSRTEDLAARVPAEELRTKLLDKAEKARRAKEKLGEIKSESEKSKPTFGTFWGIDVESDAGGMDVGSCEMEGRACCGSH